MTALTDAERDVLETLRDCGGTLYREPEYDDDRVLAYKGTPRPFRRIRAFFVPRADETSLIDKGLVRRTDVTIRITPAGRAALEPEPTTPPRGGTTEENP